MDKNLQRTEVKPFVKWAGGKGQLLRTFENFYPVVRCEGEKSIYLTLGITDSKNIYTMDTPSDDLYN